MVGTKWHEIKDLENLETELWFYDGRLIEQINGGKAQRNGALPNWGEELVRNYVKNMSDVDMKGQFWSLCDRLSIERNTSERKHILQEDSSNNIISIGQDSRRK